jgi:hypothetical protein
LYTIPVPRDKARQKSRERLGDAIYLLLYFIEACDWKTGRLHTNYEKITAETGFPERTIKRWMVALKHAGEIAARRVPNGFVVALLDYEAIARTRRVPRPKNTPKAAEPPASDRPDPAWRSTGNGLSNIKQILSKMHVQSTSKRDSSIDAHGDQTPPPPAPATAPTKAVADHRFGLEKARQMLSGLGEQELSALRTRAMEELEDDPMPFYGNFVRRNSLGELEPNPDRKPHMLQIRMAEILAREIF